MFRRNPPMTFLMLDKVERISDPPGADWSRKAALITTLVMAALAVFAWWT
jgi:hypothetical protein